MPGYASSLVTSRGNVRGDVFVKARGVVRFAQRSRTDRGDCGRAVEPYPTQPIKPKSGHRQHLHGQHRRRHDECRDQPGDQDRMPQRRVFPRHARQQEAGCQDDADTRHDVDRQRETNFGYRRHAPSSSGLVSYLSLA